MQRELKLARPVAAPRIACPRCHDSGFRRVMDPEGLTFAQWIREVIPCDCPRGREVNPMFLKEIELMGKTA